MNKIALNKILVSVFVVLLLCLLSVSCYVNSEIPINTTAYEESTLAVSMITITQTSVTSNLSMRFVIRTPQISITSEMKVTPRITRTPANTISPIDTLIPIDTPIPTWTPLPEIDAQGPEIESLMRTNNYCRLPCWWGITPGVTSWQEARQFFESIGSVEEAVFSTSTQPKSDSYIAFFWNPGTNDSNGASIEVTNDIVHTIRVDPETSRYSFQLNQLLTDYGPPQMVLIRETKEFPSVDYYNYSIVLFYSESHFLAQFYFSAKKHEESIRACLGRGPFIDIWSDKEDWTIEWIQQKIDYYNKGPFKSIEEVSTLTPSSFRESFLNDSSDNCFDISP